MLLEPPCTGSITSGWHHLVLESFFLVVYYRLGRIKRSQVMSMEKFSPTALNFGYDFVLLAHFLGHPVVYPILSIKGTHYILASAKSRAYQQNKTVPTIKVYFLIDL